MKILSVASLVISLSATLAFANQEEKIIGGSTVGAGDPVVSSTVGLMLQSPRGTGICTASLIAADLAITAAHCADGTRPSALTLVFARDMRKLSQVPAILKVKVVKYEINPTWAAHQNDSTNTGDLAILKLQTTTLPTGYAPAKILGLTNDLQTAETTTLAGYGITIANPGLFQDDGAGLLRKTQVTIQEARFSTTEALLDQTQGHGACHGDSGGPAFVTRNGQPTLWGVTSRGFPENAPDDCAHQAIYTRINAYQSWVTAAAARLRAVPTTPGH